MSSSCVERSVLDEPRELLVVLPDGSRGRVLASSSPSFYDELMAAAERQERSDPQSRGVWHEVLSCVRLTSLALQLEASVDDTGARAVTVAYALSAGRRGSLALHRRLRHDHRRSARTLGVRYTLRPGSPVERTSLRLTGLLLGATPADLELLDAALANHNDALESWRATLTQQLRTASTPAIPAPRAAD